MITPEPPKARSDWLCECGGGDLFPDKPQLNPAKAQTVPENVDRLLRYLEAYQAEINRLRMSTNIQEMDAAQSRLTQQQFIEIVNASVNLLPYIRSQEAEIARLRGALQDAVQYMTEKGVSHEYAVMINARKALSPSLP